MIRYNIKERKMIDLYIKYFFEYNHKFYEHQELDKNYDIVDMDIENNIFIYMRIKKSELLDIKKEKKFLYESLSIKEIKGRLEQIRKYKKIDYRKEL